jgi:uncharacterized protein DUF6896
MTDSQSGYGADVEEALSSFVEAKAAMEGAFGTRGAAAVVRSVITRTQPRSGWLPDGREYFVHGIGYTVVLSDESPAHIDADESGQDIFSSYDMMYFLQEHVGLDASAWIHRAYSVDHLSP